MAGKGDRHRNKNTKRFEEGYDLAFVNKKEKEVVEVMHTYEECEAHYRSYCGYGDPSIVIAFLLKEIRCRDRAIERSEQELLDLIESEGL